MATGFSPTYGNEILDYLTAEGGSSNPPTAISAYPWVKLHVGDPGAAGTANAATETTRKQTAFATPASGGAISNTSALTWTAVAGTEDYTHFSVWDASTNGNFLYSGTVTANPVTAGDTFTIAVGDLDITIGIAS